VPLLRQQRAQSSTHEFVVVHNEDFGRNGHGISGQGETLQGWASQCRNVGMLSNQYMLHNTALT
jgi:hypothetical protein